MVDRGLRARLLVPTLAAAALVLGACTGGSGATSTPSDAASRPGAGPAASTSASSAAGGSSRPSSATASPTLRTPSVPPSAVPTVSTAAYLCQAAQDARDVADAYIGSLSAGDLDQALACVAPDAADARARTPALVVTGSTQGVAYQLDASRSSGSVLVYTGRATVTLIVATVGGHLWITEVRT